MADYAPGGSQRTTTDARGKIRIWKISSGFGHVWREEGEGHCQARLKDSSRHTRTECRPQRKETLLGGLVNEPIVAENNMTILSSSSMPALPD